MTGNDATLPEVTEVTWKCRHLTGSHLEVAEKATNSSFDTFELPQD